MANGELVRQIGDLLEYLYGLSRINPEVPGFKETAGNIYNAIYYGLCRQKKDERLERLEAIVQNDNADITSFCFYTSKILLDYSSEVILEYEEILDADLIVMGSRGLGVVKGVLLGSVSQYIIERAQGPVLIVK